MYTHTPHNAEYEKGQPLSERVKHRSFLGGVVISEYRDSPLETFQRIIYLIRDSQDNSRYSYQIRDWAIYILKQFGAGKGADGKISAIYEWVKANMNYVNDPAWNELIHSSEVLLRRWREMDSLYGDCDDFTILICSLLLAVGVPCRIRMIKQRQKDGQLHYSHIYAMARDQAGNWLALDATEKDKYLGWEPPHPSGQHKDFTFA